MKAECYQSVLDDNLLRFMQLQDGTPCHALMCIKTVLAEQPFEVKDWPGNSPDLNPV
jgi:hypothetical protein